MPPAVKLSICASVRTLYAFYCVPVATLMENAIGKILGFLPAQNTQTRVVKFSVCIPLLTQLP